MGHVSDQPVAPVEQRPSWGAWVRPEIREDGLEEAQGGGDRPQDGVGVIFLRPRLQLDEDEDEGGHGEGPRERHQGTVPLQGRTLSIRKEISWKKQLFYVFFECGEEY